MECQILFTLYSTVVLDAIPCRCAQLHRCSATRGNAKKLFEVDGNGVYCWASNGRIGGAGGQCLTCAGQRASSSVRPS